MVVGGDYRVTLSLRAPYTDDNIQNVDENWRSITGVNDNVITKSVTIHYPINGVWKAVIEYTPTTPGFTLDQFGSLCQSIISRIISSTALIATTVEQFVTKTVSDVGGAAAGAVGKIVTPLNPALIVVGIVALVFLFRR